MRKLRIAMLGHKRIPSREGGIEIVVDKLSTLMVEKGHDVTVYNRGGKHVSGEEYGVTDLKEYNGVRLKKVITIDKKGLAAMTSSFFAALCAAFGRYDVVHFHAEGPCAFAWLPKLFGKRVVATIHGFDWKTAKWGKFAREYIKFGERMAVKYADKIIVLSEGAQKYFKDIYGRETEIISNGIDKPQCIDADIISAKWGLQKDSYILFLGRIVQGKGVEFLIEAFKKLNTDKKLVIAGGASDSADFMDEIIEMAKGNDRIIFTGFVQGQELDELYSNAYVYAFPSEHEGMPISLLEAMSYGNCCLVSDIPECKVIVEDKAELFEKSNAEDLKRKLQMLCDNQEIVEKYKNGASDYVCNKFRWDEITDKILTLYV